MENVPHGYIVFALASLPPGYTIVHAERYIGDTVFFLAEKEGGVVNEYKSCVVSDAELRLCSPTFDWKGSYHDRWQGANLMFAKYDCGDRLFVHSSPLISRWNSILKYAFLGCRKGGGTAVTYAENPFFTREGKNIYINCDGEFGTTVMLKKSRPEDISFSGCVIGHLSLSDTSLRLSPYMNWEFEGEGDTLELYSERNRVKWCGITVEFVRNAFAEIDDLVGRKRVDVVAMMKREIVVWQGEEKVYDFLAPPYIEYIL